MKVFFSSQRTIVMVILGILSVPAIADTVLVTGANRGIGLEFVRQYADRGWTVIATHRRSEPPETLLGLQRAYPNLIRIESMDVTSQSQIEALAAAYDGVAIDVLVNNAALIGRQYGDQQSIGTLNYDLFDVFMHTNVQGPLMVSEAFLPHIGQGKRKRIVAISSMAGSLTNSARATPNRVFYKVSKAGLNMAMARFAAATKAEGVTVAIISPGLVRTEDLQEVKSEHFVELDESVSKMISLIDGIPVDDSGGFWDYTGKRLPW